MTVLIAAMCGFLLGTPGGRRNRWIASAAAGVLAVLLVESLLGLLFVLILGGFALAGVYTYQELKADKRKELQ